MSNISQYSLVKYRGEWHVGHTYNDSNTIWYQTKIGLLESVKCDQIISLADILNYWLDKEKANRD